MKKQKRKVPRLKIDKAAEKFLEQDLSDLDFSQFKPVKFEFEKKDASTEYAPSGELRARPEGAGQNSRRALSALCSRNIGTGPQWTLRSVRPVFAADLKNRPPYLTEDERSRHGPCPQHGREGAAVVSDA